MKTLDKTAFVAGGLPKTWQELKNSLRLLAELRRTGWQSTLSPRSWSNESPPPHLNYQAVDFLERVITRESRVLEWSSGTSTAFFAKRAALTVSIEHDPVWMQRLPTLENHEVHLVESKYEDWYRDDTAKSYSSKPLDLGVFDVVLIDGLARLDCARVAETLLAPRGFIVLDDLHDPGLGEARAHLGATMEGIEFWGVRPYSGTWGGTGIYASNFSSALDANYRFSNHES